MKTPASSRNEDEPHQRNRALLFGLRLADADGHVDHAHQAHEWVEHQSLSTTNGLPVPSEDNENHAACPCPVDLVWTILLAGLTLVGACSSGPAEKPAAVDQAAPPPAAPAAASVTEALVADATISGLFARPATFVDGSHEGAPFTPGGAARPLAVMMAPLVRLGELDAVPGADAAVVIASNEGGSGERITLAIVAMRSGTATGVATATVGDRTKVRDVRWLGRISPSTSSRTFVRSPTVRRRDAGRRAAAHPDDGQRDPLAAAALVGGNHHRCIGAGHGVEFPEPYERRHHHGQWPGGATGSEGLTLVTAVHERGRTSEEPVDCCIGDQGFGDRGCGRCCRCGSGLIAGRPFLRGSDEHAPTRVRPARMARPHRVDRARACNMGFVSSEGTGRAFVVLNDRCSTRSCAWCA